MRTLVLIQILKLKGLVLLVVINSIHFTARRKRESKPENPNFGSITTAIRIFSIIKSVAIRN